MSHDENSDNDDGDEYDNVVDVDVDDVEEDEEQENCGDDASASDDDNDENNDDLDDENANDENDDQFDDYEEDDSITRRSTSRDDENEGHNNDAVVDEDEDEEYDDNNSATTTSSTTTATTTISAVANVNKQQQHQNCNEIDEQVGPTSSSSPMQLDDQAKRAARKESRDLLKQKRKQLFKKLNDLRAYWQRILTKEAAKVHPETQGLSSFPIVTGHDTSKANPTKNALRYCLVYNDSKEKQKELCQKLSRSDLYDILTLRPLDSFTNAFVSKIFPTDWVHKAHQLVVDLCLTRLAETSSDPAAANGRRLVDVKMLCSGFRQYISRDDSPAINEASAPGSGSMDLLAPSNFSTQARVSSIHDSLTSLLLSSEHILPPEVVNSTMSNNNNNNNTNDTHDNQNSRSSHNNENCNPKNDEDKKKVSSSRSSSEISKGNDDGDDVQKKKKKKRNNNNNNKKKKKNNNKKKLNDDDDEKGSSEKRYSNNNSNNNTRKKVSQVVGWGRSEGILCCAIYIE